MSRLTAIAATALCHLIVGLVGDGASTFADERSILELRHSFETPSGEKAGFAEVSDVDSVAEPPEHDGFSDPSANGPSEMSPVDDGYSAAFECCDCDRLIADDCCMVEGHRRWIIDFGASALQSQMAVADTDSWPHDFGPAGRITVGYESEGGLGIRTQAWAYSMEGDIRTQSLFSSFIYPPYYLNNYLVPGAFSQFPYPYAYNYARRIKLNAATVYLDVYKSIHSRHGEFAIGMGPAFGHLEFGFPPAGDGSSYYGGGVSVFGQGYVPIIERHRWEIALTGQTRAALLTGNWNIEVPGGGTDHSENMSILELSVGPELRYRIGSADDRYLFLRTVAEFQQWRSDRMGPIAGDTLGLQGASMNFGVLW